jgi:multidrug transporter EmrE-like cation transporter
LNKAGWVLLCIFLVLNLAASVCFKEGGTNPALHWLCFVVGNVLGIASTWFIMLLYLRVNANVAMALTSSLGFVSVQLVYWRLYHSPLDLLQWIGIGIVLVGTLMATWSPGPASATQVIFPALEDNA